MRPRSSLARLSWVPPCLAGVAAFLVVVGPRVLDPGNLAWLRGAGDPMTHYLGWAFFRQSPWTLPLGLNPDYGLELASSILYTDSIPLFALLGKALSPLLPDPFQYFGIWLLVCFVLQAFFAWRLVGLVTANAALRLASSAVFVFAPPMLFRLGGHWALVGHWPILAALWLVLRPDRQRQGVYWSLLTACAALIHTYLFAMVTLLWLSAWVTDLWLRRQRRLALALELLAVPASFFLALWQAGLFVVGEGKSYGGFGSFRMNLNAPINPFGWSRVLPTLRWKPADYEGFAYLGLGILLMTVLAVPAVFLLRRRGELTLRREWLPLGLALIALTVFAASNQVGFGLHGFSYDVPPLFETAAGMIRASGRMFWPVFYALLLAAVALIVRGYRAGHALVLILVALVVQVVDTSAGWQLYQAHFRKRGSIRSPLTSAFWYDAPELYRRVRLVPPGNLMENWAVIADYAQRHRLATDAVYAARVDIERARELATRTTAMLSEGVFDPDTLYILQGGTARLVPCVIDPARDQLAFVDGFWVLMPGWKRRFGDRYAGQLRLECPVLSPEGEPLVFVFGSEATAVLTAGWSTPEAWGTWSDGPRSVLSLKVAGRVSAVELAMTPAIRPGPPLEVQVSVDDRPSATWQMPGHRDPRWYRVSLPETAGTGPRIVRIGLAYSDIRSPASFGHSKDRRRIAVGLRHARAMN